MATSRKSLSQIRDERLAAKGKQFKTVKGPGGMLIRDPRESPEAFVKRVAKESLLDRANDKAKRLNAKKSRTGPEAGEAVKSIVLKTPTSKAIEAQKKSFSAKEIRSGN